jgi:hypothetical protein
MTPDWENKIPTRHGSELISWHHVTASSFFECGVEDVASASCQPIFSVRQELIAFTMRWQASPQFRVLPCRNDAKGPDATIASARQATERGDERGE